MISRIRKYLRKKKEVKHLCERMRYGFMDNDCLTEGVMRHTVDGIWYEVTVERVEDEQ